MSKKETYRAKLDRYILLNLYNLGSLMNYLYSNSNCNSNRDFAAVGCTY